MHSVMAQFLLLIPGASLQVYNTEQVKVPIFLGLLICRQRHTDPCQSTVGLVLK